MNILKRNEKQFGGIPLIKIFGIQQLCSCSLSINDRHWTSGKKKLKTVAPEAFFPYYSNQEK